MEIVFRELFLYLAIVYLINGLLINLLRKLGMGDFIANILTGVFFGILLLTWDNIVGIGTVPDFAGNKPIVFASQLGLLLFMMQIGFNMDFRFFRALAKHLVFRSIMLLVINFCLMVILCITAFAIPNPWTILFISVAFIGINAGAALSNNFPVADDRKRPLTNLVQMAIFADVCVVILFSIFSIFQKVGNYQAENLSIDVTSAVVMALFFLPLVGRAQVRKVFSKLERFTGDYLMVLKLSIFCFFLYFGLQVGLSVFLLGFWAGIMFKSFSGAEQTEIENKFFPVASFLYILPFVEIGRVLIVEAGIDIFSLFVLFSTLLTLALGMILFMLLDIRKKLFTHLILMAVFARGEITILLLWLARQMVPISYPVFAGMIGAVIFTSVITRLFLSGRLKKPAESLAGESI